MSLYRELGCKSFSAPGADEGQRDGVCGRGGLLQSQQRHRQRRQRGERSPQHQVEETRGSSYILELQTNIFEV